MKLFSSLVLVSLGLADAALNVSCSGGGLPTGAGVCIFIADCAAAGGTSDIPDLRCCVKAPCAPVGGGTCSFTNTCAGTSLTGNALILFTFHPMCLTAFIVRLLTGSKQLPVLHLSLAKLTKGLLGTKNAFVTDILTAERPQVMGL
ncbi:hypothetical protein B0H19DRAFT_1272030 [Mycena capillaripes]|nr:hypothetical protein B0H19DRAFT_1272030 [Mycena capillaripes]